MKIHVLSGFLGSGKTTAIQKAARILMQKGIKTGIIANDQGATLVDGSFFKSLGIPAREVVNGCFCCNYKDLDAGIASLAAIEQTETIFAESVGSCTDIVATVLKPLQQFRGDAGTTLSVFADARLLQMMLLGSGSFDDSVRYIYMKQLEEAHILVVNKIDLMPPQAIWSVKHLLQHKYSNKIIQYQNSLNDESIGEWLKLLDQFPFDESSPSLDINYDVYAAGEASMAWADQALDIYSENDTALQATEYLINALYTKTAEQHCPIGHLKFLVNKATKISFTSAYHPLAQISPEPAASVDLLVNMRVQAAPETLVSIIGTAVRETEQQYNCRIAVSKQAAFQPGYPRPAYRMQ